ncbi:MAG TPA: phosphoribosylamine--glycine ligase [Microlunatus sp.]|nr:phosphoribosylamine--glycine ligase [Microlunatus sp.]
MRVLIIGSGGREHALARAVAADPAVTEVHAAPGNPGIAECATNHPVDPLNGAEVAALAGRLRADLVVVGPEAPLVAGVADAVREAGIAVFGPSAAAARIEGSKSFAKEIMAAAGVPTAEARTCTTEAEIDAALDAYGPPYVVKDDGLASGKGVVVTEDRVQAREHALRCQPVVIEEFLAGPEVSLFAITDGTEVRPLRPAQDFKRAYDDDAGPNTGGMGSYTPLPWAPDDLVDEVRRTVLQPTVDELRKRGTPFVGLLYAGLALTPRGVRVIEFNARFGDPETQSLLPLLRTPLATLLAAAANGDLSAQPELEWADAASVTVVLASHGYPAGPRTGDPLTIGEQPEGAHVIHAGTALDDQGGLVSAGGRVLAVVGVGDDLDRARALAYQGLERIELPGSFHRADIAAAAAAQSIDRVGS